jgi:hypothetical protein
MRGCWVALLALTLGCRSAERSALYIDPALAALVPPDAVMVAGARMESLRATPTYKRWVAGKPQPLLDDLARKLGLDPRKDLWELLVTSDGKQTVALARGKFGVSGLEPRFEGARRTPYKGYTLIGDERAAVVFMNSTTAAAGPAAALRALIDRRGRTRGVSPLIQKARSLPPGAQVWMVSSDARALAAEVPPKGNAAVLAKILSMLETATFAADLRSGLRLEASGMCRTEGDARTLQDALRGLIGLARLSTPDDAPELLRVYDGINLRQDQRSLQLRADISQELLDKLIPRIQQGGLALPRPGAGLPGAGGL